MNEIMSLSQLEKLSKNPHYKLSEAQIKRLDELRANQYISKHDYSFRKDIGPIVKHNSKIEEEKEDE